jgi:GNAT superfamily N-acetyltransferase
MEPEFRRGRHAYQLLCAAEDWATRQGLGCLKMVAPAGSHIGTFYERAGFTAVETTWQKFLGPQLITGTVQ